MVIGITVSSDMTSRGNTILVYKLINSCKFSLKVIVFKNRMDKNKYKKEIFDCISADILSILTIINDWWDIYHILPKTFGYSRCLRHGFPWWHRFTGNLFQERKLRKCNWKLFLLYNFFKKKKTFTFDTFLHQAFVGC